MVVSVAAVVADGSKPAGTIEPKKTAIQPLTVPRGADIAIKLSVLKADHTVYDLTGQTVKLGIRQYKDDANPIAVKTAALTDAPNGLAEVTIPSADTAPLAENFDFLYDVLLVDAASRRWQIVPASPFRIGVIVVRPGE